MRGSHQISTRGVGPFLRRIFFSGRGVKIFQVGESNSIFLTGGVTKIQLGEWDLFLQRHILGQSWCTNGFRILYHIFEFFHRIFCKWLFRFEALYALCSRNFQNVKLRLDFVEIWWLPPSNFLSWTPLVEKFWLPYLKNFPLQKKVPLP